MSEFIIQYVMVPIGAMMYLSVFAAAIGALIHDIRNRDNGRKPIKEDEY